MKVLVLGGTGFVGRHVVERLLAAGDEVLVAHRGRAEPEGFPDVPHLHTDRRSFAGTGGFRPDAVVDCCASTRADVEAVHPHLPADAHLVELSSQDVYRAYELMRDGLEGEPVPGDEDSALRDRRHPYRGLGFPDVDEDYDKLDVEPATLARGGTVLRLAMVYGEHDPQRREELVLRRVRAGRTRIPVGSGGWLWTRLYAGDAAAAVDLALRTEAARGAVLNLGETRTRSTLGWMRQVLAAAGHEAELVPVPDAAVPDDLRFTRGRAQHLLTSSASATALLGWRPSDPQESIARSVAWHLAHPPADPDPDFSADDAALSAR
ncbi:MAG TPA: NAD-dependent epimerase/dehydratase family protein [Mycobacteriales bacterium]